MNTMDGLATSSTAMVSRLRCSTLRPVPGEPTMEFLMEDSSTRSITSPTKPAAWAADTLAGRRRLALQRAAAGRAAGEAGARAAAMSVGVETPAEARLGPRLARQAQGTGLLQAALRCKRCCAAAVPCRPAAASQPLPLYLQLTARPPTPT